MVCGWVGRKSRALAPFVPPCVGLFAAAQATLCAITNCGALTACASLEQVTPNYGSQASLMSVKRFFE